MLEIQRVCPLCGAMNVIKVPKKGYEDWMYGKAIQFALPELSEDDRELLLSGICAQCFDRVFADA